jgi:hypothetical protein
MNPHYDIYNLNNPFQNMMYFISVYIQMAKFWMKSHYSS